MGLIWTALLAVFTSSSPLDHKFISPQEKNYLVKNISSSELSVNETKTLLIKKPVIYQTHMKDKFHFFLS